MNVLLQRDIDIRDMQRSIETRESYEAERKEKAAGHVMGEYKERAEEKKKAAQEERMPVAPGGPGYQPQPQPKSEQTWAEWVSSWFAR